MLDELLDSYIHISMVNETLNQYIYKSMSAIQNQSIDYLETDPT